MYKDTDELVAAWIRYHQKDKHKDNDPDFAAWEHLHDLAHSDPETALKIMDMIVARSDDPHILAAIGAGPLEDLLGNDHGTRYVDSVIDRARKFKNWRFAFGCVWEWGFKDKEVAAKIKEQIDEFFPHGRP